MKKHLLLAVLFICTSAVGITAEENRDNLWGSFYSPGNMAFEVGGSISFSGIGSLNAGVQPGFEYIILKHKLFGLMPLDIGVAARAAVAWSAADNGLWFRATINAARAYKHKPDWHGGNCPGSRRV